MLQNFDIFFRRKKVNINTLCLETKNLFFTQCCARPNPDAAVACETKSFDRPVCGFLYIKCLFIFICHVKMYEKNRTDLSEGLFVYN